MIVNKIEGATRFMNKPQNWNGELNGHCGVLPIRDETIANLPAMTSAWEPTPRELEILNAGGKVYLTVIGMSHPPVSLWVE